MPVDFRAFEVPNGRLNAGWVDLALEQLEAMKYQPETFEMYKASLYCNVVRAIAESNCDDPALCCEVLTEVELIEGPNPLENKKCY